MVFFMKQFPTSHRVSHSDRFKFFRRDIRKSRCITAINNTCVKFATHINDTGGKFATGIKDTGGKQ
jgi:hypothetical protein